MGIEIGNTTYLIALRLRQPKLSEVLVIEFGVVDVRLLELSIGT